jgi:predicted kinase
MTFFMMCGPAGSGKTTKAKEFVNEDPQFRVWISSDDIRRELYGDESIQSGASYVFDLMEERTIDALKRGKIVVYDAMNLRAKERKIMLDKLKEMFPELVCLCVSVEVPLESALQRNSSRARQVPEKIIRSQFKRFESPTEKEGWDDILVIND